MKKIETSLCIIIIIFNLIDELNINFNVDNVEAIFFNLNYKNDELYLSIMK